MALRTFQHDGRTYSIVQDPKSANTLDVISETDDPIMVIVGKTANVWEGRYGNFELFAGQYEFFKTPISTRLETGTVNFDEAVEFVAKHYLNTIVESVGGETD